MAHDQPATCPVCNALSPRPFQEVDGRRYWRRETCEATFLDVRQLPSAEDERTHYQHHENHPDDPGYRRFLSKLATPLLEKLESGLSALDYGCGPGPALAVMLEEAGHRVTLYDPFFYPNAAALDTTFDVITCTEVAEHFHRPFDAFNRLNRLLRPGAWLGIMTCFQTDDARFASWHYRRDPTHVVFYKEATLCHIAGQRGWICDIVCKDVALMWKPGHSGR